MPFEEANAKNAVDERPSLALGRDLRLLHLQ